MADDGVAVAAGASQLALGARRSPAGPGMLRGGLWPFVERQLDPLVLASVVTVKERRQGRLTPDVRMQSQCRRRRARAEGAASDRFVTRDSGDAN